MGLHRNLHRDASKPLETGVMVRRLPPVFPFCPGGPGMWNPRLCLPGGARDITRSSPGVSRKFCPKVGLLRLLHKKASNPALPQVQLFGIMPNKHPLFIQIIIKKLPLTVA